MDYFKSSKLVNNKHIKNFTNSTIVIYGKVKSTKHDSMYLNINPDNEEEQIIVRMNKEQQRNNFTPNSIYKIFGEVQVDGSLTALHIFAIEDTFSWKNANNLANLMHNKNLNTYYL